MAVTAPETPQGRRHRRKSLASAVDRLIPLSMASSRLGYSPDTLRRWHSEGHMPAVIGPGGMWSTYESFVEAVLGSARPGHAGVIEQIARDWFAAHAEAVAS